MEEMGLTEMGLAGMEKRVMDVGRAACWRDRGTLERFWKGKRVLVTGHTGFKGAWLSRILLGLGAKVCGYSLGVPTEPSLYELSGLEGQNGRLSFAGDIRDLSALRRAFETFHPEVVFHLAAQPIVRLSYRDPADTYAVNVMGTVNLLECLRTVPGVHSAVIITTDKVYRNNEWEWGYREDDVLDGADPYSNSKSCAELAARCYRQSFLDEMGVRLSTVRAGNVIGGGDFAADRILPDCFRAALAGAREGKAGASVLLRNPRSTRPYEHVFEPLFFYMGVAMAQYDNAGYCGCYNVGPGGDGCLETRELVQLFCDAWNDGRGSLPKLGWEGSPEEGAPPEAGLLKLDTGRAKAVFGWEPAWDIREGVAETAGFYRMLAGGLLSGKDCWEAVLGAMDASISRYLEE